MTNGYARLSYAAIATLAAPLGAGVLAWRAEWSLPGLIVIVVVAVIAAFVLLCFAYNIYEEKGPRALLLSAVAVVVGLWLLQAFRAGDVLALVPVLFVAVCGGCAFMAAEKMLGDARLLFVRCLPGLLAAGFGALAIVVFCERDLLTTLPAAALLFPIGVAAAFRVRRMMSVSPRLPVRVGSDIVFSLLLGMAVVLAIAWAANVFRMPHAQLAAMRAVLDGAGALIEVPWYVWPELYLALAIVAWVLLPWREARGDLEHGARLTRTAAAAQRALGVTHIVLLVAALVGASAPLTAQLAMREPMRARLTMSLRQQIEAQAAKVAYAEIQRQFSRSESKIDTSSLGGIIREIHNISPPPNGGTTTHTERSLARRIGLLQSFLATGVAVSVPRAAGPTASIHDLRDLRGRIDQLDRQDTIARDRTDRMRRLFAEPAAKTVTGLLSVPGIANGEVAQLVRDYLAGLVEEGPLNRLFSGWASVRGVPPVEPGAMVVPRPDALEAAALGDLPPQLRRTEGTKPIQDAPPLRRAVELENEARYVAENTGPCPDCDLSHLHGSGDNPAGPGEEHGRPPGEHEPAPAEPRPAEPPRIIEIPF